MIRTTRALLALLIVGTAFSACKSNSAAKDLEKLKEKTCSCKDDSACLDEAKAMAKQWVEKHHGSTPDPNVVEAITDCSLDVGLDLN